MFFKKYVVRYSLNVDIDIALLFIQLNTAHTVNDEGCITLIARFDSPVPRAVFHSSYGRVQGSS